MKSYTVRALFVNLSMEQECSFNIPLYPVILTDLLKDVDILKWFVNQWANLILL